MTKQRPDTLPQISPYIFPVLLAGFGLWCFFDGWISADPKMQQYLLFNRTASGVLLLWAVVDFIRTRQLEKAEPSTKNPGQPTE